MHVCVQARGDQKRFDPSKNVIIIIDLIRHTTTSAAGYIYSIVISQS